MALHNRDIVLQSRAALHGKWGLAIGGFVLYVALLLVMNLVSYLVPLGGSVISFFMAGPIAVGLVSFYLKISRNDTPQIADIFSGFSNFLNAMIAYLVFILFTFLWTLLLIIPGIMAAYAYSMTFYIVADNPNLSGLQALRLSRAMMNGFRWKLFCLGWRYIGWILLGIITLGIGFLWVFPMIQVAFSKFYDDVKAEYEAKAPPSNPAASIAIA